MYLISFNKNVLKNWLIKNIDKLLWNVNRFFDKIQYFFLIIFDSIYFWPNLDYYAQYHTERVDYALCKKTASVNFLLSLFFMITGPIKLEIHLAYMDNGKIF